MVVALISELELVVVLMVGILGCNTLHFLLEMYKWKTGHGEEM